MRQNYILILISIPFFMAGISMSIPNQSNDTTQKSKVELRRGIPHSSDTTNTNFMEEYRRRTLQRIEPVGKPVPERINDYLSRYKDIAVFDPKVMCFDVRGKSENGKIVLTGMVSLQEEKDGLLNFLPLMNLGEIEDRIEVLPCNSLGAQRYAIAKVPLVVYYSQPSGMQEHLTESTLGDSIFLQKFDEKNGYYYAQHSNGYLGWVKQEDVLPMDLTEFRKWRSGTKALFRKSYQDESTGVFIPLGADLPISTDGKIIIPGNEPVSVPTGYYRVYDIKPAAWTQELLENAKEFLEVPYVWGGVSNQGVDCSGFVMILNRSFGINLARDADEQFLAGEIVGWRGNLEDMLPGDLIYFCAENGRISHTGIYAGKGKFIHAAEPVVRYNSFNPEAPEYSAKLFSRFVYGRRVKRVTE
jgi:hypothetical protein